jgi:hypothetical protein
MRIQTPEFDGRPRRLFVISPIDADGSEVRVRSDKVLEFIIREALPTPEFVVRRGDGARRTRLRRLSLSESVKPA